MSIPQKDRKVRSGNGNDGADEVPAGAAGFAMSVSAALKAEYGDRGSAVKRVAMLTGANPRAVKNWFEARNAPSGMHLVALARHSDEVFRLVLLLAGRRIAGVVLEIDVARVALRRASAALDVLP